MNSCEALQIGQRSALYEYYYIAHLSNRQECPRAIHRQIRPNTGRNDDSSCVWAEDGYFHLPHELIKGGRVTKSPSRKLVVMTFYRDAPWRIRTFFIKFKAFPERQQHSKNHEFYISKSLIIGYIGLTENSVKIQVLQKMFLS